ncbi:MAG: hypothetical protein NTY65_04600 [Planctomycetota bacterium]|nr:hypothetical protein [Planctomycetota bacterium]
MEKRFRGASSFADSTGGAAVLTTGTVIDVYFLDNNPAMGGYKAKFFAAQIPWTPLRHIPADKAPARK